jgi:hypothetical protein
MRVRTVYKISVAKLEDKRSLGRYRLRYGGNIKSRMLNELNWRRIDCSGGML